MDDEKDTAVEGAGTSEQTDLAPDHTLPEDLPDPDEEGLTPEERAARTEAREQAKAAAAADRAEARNPKAADPGVDPNRQNERR